MSVRSAQSITVEFTTRSFSTGAGVNADSLPTGTLVLNGTDNAAAVTVTNVDTGRYKAAVTLPTLALNDIVEIAIAATVNSVSDKAIIWRETKDFFAGSVPDVVAGGSGGLLISGTNTGTTTLGALTVSGATTLAALSLTTLTASGAVAFQSTLIVSGATTLTGLTTGALACTTITASGAVAFQSTFAVTTSTALAALSCSTLTASGAVALQSTLTVTGATSLAALSTSGTATFNALTVTNATTLSGAVSLGSTLTVTGTTSLAALTTSGTTTLNALTVTNATTLSGAVALGSTLSVTGATTLAALSMTTLTASGAVAFQSTFAVTTSTSLAALSCTTLTASGAVAFQSTFGVTGTTTLAALNTGAIGTGNVTITGTLSTSGTTTLNALTVTNALTVSGATTFTGAVTASNASNNIVGIDVAKAAGVAWASGAITASSIAADAITAAKIADGAIDRATFAADTGLQTIRSNTCQASGSTTTAVKFDAGASSTDEFYTNCLLYLTGGTGAGQLRMIVAYNGTTKIATVGQGNSTFDIPLLTAADGTTTFSVLANIAPLCGVDTISALAANYPWLSTRNLASTMLKVDVGAYESAQTPLQPTVAGRTLDVSATGEAGVDWANVGSPTTSVNLSGTTISTSQAVASVSGAVGSVTGNVGGNVTGSVGSISGITFPTNFAALGISVGGHITNVDTLTTYTGNTPQTGDSYSIVNSGTFGNAAIKGYVDDIGVAGAGLTALGDTRIANLDATITSRMATYTQPTGFLAATFPTTVASTTNITGGVITTVTNLTNAPTAGDLTATMKTSVATAVDASTAATNVSTILGRITSTLFSGITSLAQWLGALGGKQTGNSTARTEIRATGAGSGTFDETTDSLEAVRDRGDSAWGSSGGTVVLDAVQPNYAPAKAGDAMTLSSAYDLWTADVKLNRDDVNSKDEWTCIVSKNGVVQDTLTAVSIRIGHRDGSAFIGSTAMTAGSDGITWSKDFTTSNRLTAGEDVTVFITATDSLSAPHVCKVIAPITGRDSTT